MKRHTWIDVLKLIGVFDVYIGHLGTGVGRLYPFVWSFHIPLLFFSAGLLASRGEKKSISSFAVSKIRSLFLPYLCFCALSLAFYTATEKTSVRQVLIYAGKALLSVKSISFAEPLWFLPALFAMAILYRIGKRSNPDLGENSDLCCNIDMLHTVFG